MSSPQPTSAQPKASTEMTTMNPPPAARQNQDEHQQCEHHQHKASRPRGGGAGKTCLLSMCACFMCFECCEGCCDCIGDIICCPCEMCC